MPLHKLHLFATHCVPFHIYISALFSIILDINLIKIVNRTQKYCSGLLLGASLCLLANAQQASQMSFTELVAEAEFAIQNGQSSEAIPLLKEIIARAGSLEDKSAKESVQMARLQLGLAYSKLQRWTDSKQYIQEYLAGDPCEDPTSAWKILCQVALSGENWQELQEASQEVRLHQIHYRKM